MKADEKLNFKKIFDDDHHIYNDDHYCGYVEIDKIAELTTTDYFSSYSHNVQSLAGLFDDLLDILDQAKPNSLLSPCRRFGVLQESSVFHPIMGWNTVLVIWTNQCQIPTVGVVLACSLIVNFRVRF